MNKNTKRITNCCFNVSVCSFSFNSDKEFLKYLIDSGFFSYIVFQRERSQKKGEHWQGYLELKKQRYITQISSFLGEGCFIEKRRTTQRQAIMYCKKEKSRVGESFFEWGKKRRAKKIKKENFIMNKNCVEKEKPEKKKLEHLVNDITLGKYQDFFEIEKQNPILFITYFNFLVKTFNNFLSSKFFKQKEIIKNPAKVIWVFGESGSGKSVWTHSFLRKCYPNERYTFLSPNNMFSNESIRFENISFLTKILIINEVNKEFPKHNNLIQFIDRVELLQGYKTKIVNNFEVIIINSLYRPEEVFGYMDKKDIQQIFRRVWYIGCKVLEIKKNEEQLKDLKEEMIMNEFLEWYKPIVIEIKEPDYSLME